MDNLTQLEIFECEKLVNLNSLCKAKKLTDIYLFSCSEINELPNLDNLKNLTNLKIEKLFNLRFLPSLDELNEIYLNKTIINTSLVANGGTAISNNWYWTSSQQNGNANNAYYQFFGNGTQALNAKANMASVRAVRHWTDF